MVCGNYKQYFGYYSWVMLWWCSGIEPTIGGLTLSAFLILGIIFCEYGKTYRQMR